MKAVDAGRVPLSGIIAIGAQPLSEPPPPVSYVRKKAVGSHEYTDLSPLERAKADDMLRSYLELATPQTIRHGPQGYAGIILQRINIALETDRKKRQYVRSEHSRKAHEMKRLFEKHPVFQALLILAGGWQDHDLHHVIPVGYCLPEKELNHHSNLLLIQNGKSFSDNDAERACKNFHYFFHALIDPQRPTHSQTASLYIPRSAFPVFPPGKINNREEGIEWIRSENPSLLEQIQRSKFDERMLNGFLDRIVAFSEANQGQHPSVPQEFREAVMHFQNAYAASWQNNKTVLLGELAQADLDAAQPLARLLPADARIMGRQPIDIAQPPHIKPMPLPLAPNGWKVYSGAPNTLIHVPQTVRTRSATPTTSPLFGRHATNRRLQSYSRNGYR